MKKEKYNLPEKKYYKIDEINNYYKSISRKKKKQATYKNKPFWYYINPKNFKQEMKLADALINKMNIFTCFLTVIAVAMAVAYFYRLTIVSCILTILVSCMFIPAFIVISAQKKNQKKRLSDLQIYMEQILYNFKENPNILEALKETRDLFSEESMIKQAINEAIEYISSEMSENVSEEGLAIIESYYHNDRLSTVHKFMLKVEHIGGDYEKSINLLLDDLKCWGERMEEHKKNTAYQNRNNKIASILSCILCYMTVIILTDDMSITDNIIYQIGTIITFFALILIAFKSEKATNINWIEQLSKYTDKELQDRYFKTINYDEKKEKKKSIKWVIWTGIIIAVIFVVMLLLKKNVIPVILFGLLIEIFMMNQHKVSYAMNIKLLTKEINKAFPKWLMEISLRMQTDNVQISIIDSLENAPGVLKPALKQFVNEIQNAPDSIAPYTSFLKEFDVQEVHSAMKMLYSIFSGKGGNVDIQVSELIARNNIMLNQTEKMANKDALGSMYIYFLLPSIIGAAKLMVDMILVLIKLFTQL